MERSARSKSARHLTEGPPKSRAERALLRDLEATLRSARAVCNSGAGDAVVAEALGTERPPALARVNAEAPHLSSNGSAEPRLFYAMAPAAGVGLAQRRDRFTATPSALPPDQDDALRHYGVQQLSEYARAKMLGDAAQYLPSHGSAATARQRFDELLSRVQQHQLALAIKNELHARQPDAAWTVDNRRFHLAPVSGTHRVADAGAWAAFIRAAPGGAPKSREPAINIVPNVWAERAVHAPPTRFMAQ